MLEPLRREDESDTLIQRAQRQSAMTNHKRLHQIG